jgi:hypothetical protein
VRAFIKRGLKRNYFDNSTNCLPHIFFFAHLHSAPTYWYRYKHDITESGLLKKYWLLWGPVNSFTFSVIPQHFRIPFMASISFFWMIALSYISAKGDLAAEAGMEECILDDGYTCHQQS